MRNVLRGVDGNRGVAVALARFEPTLAELSEAVEHAPVSADMPSAGDAGPASIEEKAAEIDRRFWSTEVMSRAGEEGMRTLRMSGARVEAVNALAYAWLKRAEIAESIDAGRALEERLQDSMTVSDELRINSELKSLITADWNRFQELVSYVVATGASSYIAIQEPEIVKSARETSNAGLAALDPGIDSASDTFLFAQARSACEIASRRSVAEHNLLTDIRGLESYLPTLMKTIEGHDTRKTHAWNTTNALLATVSALYEDPAAAWASLSGELSTLDRTSYLEQGRYSRARTVANGVVSELMAQRATTRYGRRVANAGCTARKREESACLPFSTVAPGSRIWAPAFAEINAYYASDERQYDAYNRFGAIDTSAMSMVARSLPGLAGEPGPKTFGIDGRGAGALAGDILAERAEAMAFNLALARNQAAVMIQYRQEAMKRKLYWDALRRGDGVDFGPTLDPALRQELVANAPACFYGPAKTTSGNLASLATWFDIDPNCRWRTWSGGQFAGEQIGHEWVGGVDSSIWAIKNEIAAYNENHGGRAAIEEWANGAAGLCQVAASRAPAAGRSDVLSELQGFIAATSAVLDDAANTSRIEIAGP